MKARATITITVDYDAATETVKQLQYKLKRSVERAANHGMLISADSNDNIKASIDDSSIDVEVVEKL